MLSVRKFFITSALSIKSNKFLQNRFVKKKSEAYYLSDFLRKMPPKNNIKSMIKNDSDSLTNISPKKVNFCRFSSSL